MSDPTAQERFPAQRHLLAEEFQNFLDFRTGSRQSLGTTKRSEFKGQLKGVYGDAPEQGVLFDMATGKYLPTVVASHIFQHRWAKFLQVFTGLNDVNDVRNGLFLYRPVEVAFDEAQISIRAKNGQIRFWLLDETIRDKKLVDVAQTIRRTANIDPTLRGEEGSLTTTFGDLDGQELHFPPNSTVRPSKRLLAVYAYAAWIEAKKLGYTSSGPPDVSVSDDTSVRALLSDVSR